MKNIELTANKICYSLYEKQGIEYKIAFSPLVILMIISIIISLVRLAMECQYKSDNIRRMGFFTRWTIKRVINKAMGKLPNLICQTRQSVIEYSRGLSEEEFNLLCEDVL